MSMASRSALSDTLSVRPISLATLPYLPEDLALAHSLLSQREHVPLAQVLTVRDILKYGVSDHMGARVDLEELAMKALKYSMAEGFTVADLNEQVTPAPHQA